MLLWRISKNGPHPSPNPYIHTPSLYLSLSLWLWCGVVVMHCGSASLSLFGGLDAFFRFCFSEQKPRRWYSLLSIGLFCIVKRMGGVRLMMPFGSTCSSLVLLLSKFLSISFIIIIIFLRWLFVRTQRLCFVVLFVFLFWVTRSHVLYRCQRCFSAF